MSMFQAWVGTTNKPLQSECTQSPSSSDLRLVCERLISCRLAHFLSHIYLPPIPHELSVHSQLHRGAEKRVRPRSKSKGQWATPERIRVKTPMPVMPKVDSGRQTPRWWNFTNILTSLLIMLMFLKKYETLRGSTCVPLSLCSVYVFSALQSSM